MSRSNSKTCRVLRQKDSNAGLGMTTDHATGIKNRIRILKASNLNGGIEAVANAVANFSSSQFQNKMSKISKFQKQSKERTKKVSQQLVWTREHASLAKRAEAVESEVSHALQRLVASSATDPSAGMGSLGDEWLSLNEARDKDCEEMAAQFKEYKSLLKMALQHKKTSSLAENALDCVPEGQGEREKEKEDEDEIQVGDPAQEMAAEANVDDTTTSSSSQQQQQQQRDKILWSSASVFADVLVRFKDVLHARWEQYTSAAAELSRETCANRKRIWNTLRRSVHQQPTSHVSHFSRQRCHCTSTNNPTTPVSHIVYVA